MIEAKEWLYIEPLLPNEIVRRVKYVTDLAEDPVSCLQKDLRKTLCSEMFFSHFMVDDMEELLNSGMSIILNMRTKKFFRYDNDGPILIKQGVIRSGLPQSSTKDLTKFNKQVESIVKGKLFKE